MSEDSNPYESPEKDPAYERAEREYAVGSRFVMALIINGGLFLCVLVTRARFHAVFAQLGVQLPWLTHVFFSRSFVGLLGGLLLFTTVKEFLVVDRRLRDRWNTRIILIVLVMAALYSISIFLPFLRFLGAIN